MGKNGKGIHIRVHGKSWEKMKTKLKDLSSRRSVQSIRPSLEKIKEYMRGWLNYYGIAEMKKRIEEPNKWLYHRIRMCIWKQWKKPKTKVKNLLKPPCTERYARWCERTAANHRLLLDQYQYLSMLDMSNPRHMIFPLFVDVSVMPCGPV